MERIVTSFRLTDRERQLLEALRAASGYRSWADVVRALLEEAARRRGVGGETAGQSGDKGGDSDALVGPHPPST